MRIIKLIAHDRPVHCEVDRETRILSASDGARYALGNKEFTVLCRLAQTPGKPVKTVDLFDEAWKHSDGNLESVAKTVSDLRKKLRDTEPVKRFIETIPTVGYMLIAECEFRELPLPPPPPIRINRSEGPTPRDKPDVADQAARVEMAADSGEPEDNESVMRAIRTWKRRPGSCSNQEIVGRFEVDGCSSVEVPCARVLGIPPGDLVEVTLDTPKSMHPKAEHEWIDVNAMGPQAQFLEELADKKDRSTVVLRLQGHGAYICKRDFPDLETGKMQHYRDPKPALLVLSARLLPNDLAEELAEDHVSPTEEVTQAEARTEAPSNSAPVPQWTARAIRLGLKFQVLGSDGGSVSLSANFQLALRDVVREISEEDLVDEFDQLERLCLKAVLRVHPGGTLNADDLAYLTNAVYERVLDSVITKAASYDLFVGNPNEGFSLSETFKNEFVDVLMEEEDACGNRRSACSRTLLKVSEAAALSKGEGDPVNARMAMLGVSMYMRGTGMLTAYGAGPVEKSVGV